MNKPLEDGLIFGDALTAVGKENIACMRETQSSLCPIQSVLAFSAIHRFSCDPNSLVDNDAMGMHIRSAAHKEQIASMREMQLPVF